MKRKPKHRTGVRRTPKFKPPEGKWHWHKRPQKRHIRTGHNKDDYWLDSEGGARVPDEYRWLGIVRKLVPGDGKLVEEGTGDNKWQLIHRASGITMPGFACRTIKEAKAVVRALAFARPNLWRASREQIHSRTPAMGSPEYRKLADAVHEAKKRVADDQS